MGKPSKQQIAEARKQGIVEGALIESPAVSNLFGTVSSPSQWIVSPDGSIANGCGKISLRVYGKWATVITSPKRKAPTQPRVKGRFAAKPKETSQLDRIEGYLNKVGQAVVDQGREFKSKLSAIESSVAVIRSGATLMQQLEGDAPSMRELIQAELRSISDRLDALRMEQYALAQPANTDAPIGLQPGDYCDASKEVADELTAMGFKWYDSDRTEEAYITPMRESCNELINTHQSYDTHIDAQTFLSRARVTAKELGLKPVEAPVEVWVPKVGDWVVALPIKDRTGTLGGALDVGHEPIEVSQIDTTSCGSGRAVLVSKPPRPLHIDCRNFRKATDAEVAEAIAKRKEAERAEKVKALTFGVRVMTPEGEGIFHESSAGVGNWVIFPQGQRNFTIDELTIL